MEVHPLSQCIADYIQARADYEPGKRDDDKFRPATWLSCAARRASQINFVTHVLKYIHTGAKGSSIYAEPGADELQAYLTTASLQLAKIKIDVCGTASAMDVAELLALEANGQTLFDAITKDDTAALEPFADNREQLAEWLKGFKSVLLTKEPSSHNLAKQVYFPLQDGGYHLLAPLPSSSLIQAIYEHITMARFGEQTKEARAALKTGKAHPDDVVKFRDLGVQRHGNTKPQNVSQLNIKRGGRAYLLASKPPTWKSQLPLPVASDYAFWQQYDRRAWKTAKGLRDYLLTVKGHETSRSIKERRRYDVDKLKEQLLMLVAELRRLTDQSGWSKQSKLPVEERAMLDPHCDDENVQIEIEFKTWQEKVAGRFAGWLNRQLQKKGRSGRSLTMEDAEHKQWMREMKHALKRDLEDFD